MFQALLNTTPCCIFAMSTVGDILAELADAQTLLGNDAMRSEVKSSLVDSIIAKIKSLKSFDSSAAVKLVNALAASTFDHAYKTQLQTGIDDRLVQGFASSTKKNAVEQQCLTNPLSYLTGQDWVDIDKHAAESLDVDKMMGVIAQRYGKLGIRSLHEQSVKWAVAVPLAKVVSLTNQWPRYHKIYGWVQTFKRDFECVKTPYPHVQIVKFPSTPRELPQSVFDFAYSDGTPITKEIDNFMQLGNHIPLRSNSLLLQREVHNASWGQSAMVPPRMHAGLRPNYRSRQLADFHTGSDEEQSIPGLRVLNRDHRSRSRQFQQHLAIGDTPAAHRGEFATQRPEHGRASPTEPYSQEFLMHSPISMRSSPSPVADAGISGAMRHSPSPVGDAATSGAARVGLSMRSTSSLGGDTDASSKRNVCGDEAFSHGYKIGEPRTLPPAQEADFVVDEAEVTNAEAYELAAYNALKNRGAKKRPAGNSQAVKTEVKDEDDDDEEGGEDGDGDAFAAPAVMLRPANAVMRRPANAVMRRTANATIMRRPAAMPSVSVNAVEKRLLKDITLDYVTLRSTNRKLITSRVYHQARVVCKTKGIDDEIAKAISRKCSQKMSALWEKMSGE